MNSLAKKELLMLISKKLRQKLEKAGPQVVQTVWGVGYKFDDSEV